MAPYGNWHHFYANTIRLSAGAHTLTFSTTFPGAEATTFIDEVTVGSVSAVPEPSEWAMMLGGLGFLGLTARLRRAAGHRTSRRA